MSGNSAHRVRAVRNKASKGFAQGTLQMQGLWYPYGGWDWLQSTAAVRPIQTTMQQGQGKEPLGRQGQTRPQPAVHIQSCQ